MNITLRYFICVLVTFILCDSCKKTICIYENIIKEDFHKITKSEENDLLISFVAPINDLETLRERFVADNDIIKIRKERYNQYHSPSIAEFEFDSSNRQIQLEIFILKYSGSELEKPINFEAQILELIDEQNLHSYQGVFNIVRLLSIYADFHFFNSNIEVSLASLAYSLHILETFDDVKTIKNIHDKYLVKFLKLLVRERPINEILASAEIITSKVSKEYKETFDYEMALSHLAENQDSIEWLGHLQKAKSLVRTKEENFIVQYNLGHFYASYGRNAKALENYKKALNTFNGFSCNRNYLSLLIYYLKLGSNQKLSELYEDIKLKTSTCPENSQDFFYFLKYSYGGFGALDKEPLADEYLEFREKAEKAFPNKSTLHLQDFYLKNTIEVFNAVAKYPLGNFNKHTLKTIELFYDTKCKDVYRQKFNYKFDILKSGNKSKDRVTKLLFELNYFRNILDFKNIVYTELFQLLTLGQPNPIELKTPPINFTKLKEKLKSENRIIINLLKGPEYYVFYAYDGNKIILDTLNNEFTDKINDLVYRKIIDKKNQKSNLEGLVYDFLKDKGISNNKEIIFIPDGSFVNVPSCVWFGEGDAVYIFNNINSYIEQNQLNISPSEVNLFSFSNKESLEDEKTKMFTELLYGFEEAKSIIERLNISSSQLYTGDDFSKRILFERMNRFVHISSHASSSTNNRLDNFILTRDREEKLYGFELYSAKNVPQVVVLSACESGIGLHAYGAGVQTLSRAFLDNGTQTIIKTLWKVNEKATAELMVDMYTNWTTGISLYDALEQTKEKFKYHDEYCAPYYWAGFVLEGNPNVYLDLKN